MPINGSVQLCKEKGLKAKTLSGLYRVAAALDYWNFLL
jgi:hypothetical protein